MSNYNRRKAADGQDRIDRIRRSRLKAYLLTAVFTLVIAVILIQRLGMYPFGDHHLCYSDADQYYGFYGYLMSTFFSRNNLFYSWSMALGNGMISTYAYYTASPLNLLLVFFRKDLMLGMQVIVFIRTFLISLSFCTLLNYCSRGREVEKAILSASYAFIGYTAFYAWNASWMDGVALLPLMVLGLKKLLDRRQKLFYILVLALAVFSNFYIGYMLCAASVVFYLIYCLDFQDGRASVLDRLKGTFARYAGASILGVCLTMALVLPAYLGIPKERKKELVTLGSIIRPQFKLNEFFSMFFSGTALLEDSADNFPVIFVGILPFVLVLVYFLNRKIRTDEKIRTAVMLLILLISFEIPFINTAWHGFSVNHWFNFRYSFVFSFILLLIAYRSLTNLPEKSRTILAAGGVFLLIALLVFVVFRTDRIRLAAVPLAIDLVCGIAGTALLCACYCGRAEHRAPLRLLLCLLIIVNVSCNAVIVTGSGTEAKSVREVHAEQEKIERAKQYCEDGTITRIGRSSPLSRCEASMFAFAGVENYASTENRTTLRMLKRLGLGHRLVWSEYTRHAPRSTDDFLGIRYILYDYELRDKPFKKLETVNGTQIFENPDALPLIFETRQLYENDERDNDFEFQNGFYRSFDRDRLIDADIFEKAEYDMEVSKVGENCLAKITIEASPSDLFYMQLPKMKRMDELCYRSSVHNYLGDKEVEYTSARDIYCLGKPDEDGKITAEIGLDSASDRLGIEIYRLREDVLSAYVRQIQADQSVDVKEITSSHLKFESDRKQDALYTSSIPYDREWRVTVDGRKVKTQENAGCFLSFPVEAGKHTVELKYRPKGLGAGIALSVLALLILIGSEYAARFSRNGDKNARKNKNRKKARPHKRGKTQKRTRPAGN